jgi:tRNA (cytidine/uridine-2'-O-)-methyltransferase
VRRSGLDYRDLAEVTVHDDFAACLAALSAGHPAGRRRWFALTTRGEVDYDTVRFEAQDVLVFGPETRGLPEPVLASCPAERRLRVPMRPGVRSMNLSNAVAVVVYECWRQLRWPGAGRATASPP